VVRLFIRLQRKFRRILLSTLLLLLFSLTSASVQSAFLSLPLVRFLRHLFSPEMNQTLLSPAASVPMDTKNDNVENSQNIIKSSPRLSSVTLTSLPDELVSMCYGSLPAEDLVSLEMVSRRMQSLVSSDSMCWSRCTRQRWGSRVSNALLAASARHAGSWKALYSEKLPCDVSHSPWLVPCSSEIAAMLDFIKGVHHSEPQSSYSHFLAAKPKSVSTPEASSPRAISNLRMAGNANMEEAFVERSLSVVLLIDGSSSVTEEDFKAMKEFASALVLSLLATNSDATLGIIQFNQHPKVEQPLTPVTRGSLRHTISALDQMMGSTDIAAPIRRAKEILQNEPFNTKKAIVLLTDGQTHADELQESEKEARSANTEVNARVFTLGVGRDVDVPGLTKVATGKSKMPEDATAADLSKGCYFTLRCLAPTQ